MKKILLASLFAFASIFGAFAGEDDVVTSFAHESYLEDSSLHEKARLYEVRLTPFITYVTIEVVPTIDLAQLKCWTSEYTYVESGDARLPIIGLYEEQSKSYRSCTYKDELYFANAKAGESHFYTLAFSGRIPEGSTSFSLVDNAEAGRGYSFRNRTINNPKRGDAITEARCRATIDGTNDAFCGIYEEIGGNKNRLACIKHDDQTYILIYLGCGDYKPWWFEGDAKAVLTTGPEANIFKANWVKENKLFDEETFVGFNGTAMVVITESDTPKESQYTKVYPATTGNENTGNNGNGSSNGGESRNYNNEQEEVKNWSGTGFALYNNHIATNYHVVEGAKSIFIHGINGDFTRKYRAVVVATDKVNDLAILRLEGIRIPNNSIPYAVKTSTMDVGEEIYVLGYPMTYLMGDEIKLTKGIVNARSGFMGDVSLYQISASLQGGNSGGPVFDSNGNVVAIAVASLNRENTNTENVNYAIKASYLRNLMESSISENILPSNNKVSKLKLSEQVKSIKTFVYHITCSNVESN